MYVSIRTYAGTGAEESSRAAAAWPAENLPDMNIEAPQVSAGEVVVDF
jgi:hypothetical protein